MQGHLPCPFARTPLRGLLQRGGGPPTAPFPFLRGFLGAPRQESRRWRLFRPPTAAFLRGGGKSRPGDAAIRRFGGRSRDLRGAVCFFHPPPVDGGGYFRFPHARAISLDEGVYDVRTARGSGPGGQGTNSSSSKVEMRVDMGRLSEFFDEAVMQGIRKNEHQRALTADGRTLVVSCHAHRSAFQNKEACLKKVREMIQKASWVPLADGEPIKTPSHAISQSKTARRIKSNFSKMQRAARKGLW